ncbi:MAG: glycoside hydrolase family 99-like domain-containing protein [Lentisphaeria bacterium]|nr:glycoside hydrolase family 99-like domain-containing protein [Lentisphaeria bacterium]
MSRTNFAFTSLLLLFCLVLQGGVTILQEWRFDGANSFPQGEDSTTACWKAHQIRDLRVEDGLLKGTVTGNDGQIVLPVFAFTANQNQFFEVKIRSTQTGRYDLYFASDLTAGYSGFVANQKASVEILPCNDWQTIRIWPFWHSLGKILRFRFDTPLLTQENSGGADFEIEYFRLGEVFSRPNPRKSPEWHFPQDAGDWLDGNFQPVETTEDGIILRNGNAMTLCEQIVSSINDGAWLTLEMTATAGEYAQLTWGNSLSFGQKSWHFPVRGDGKRHTYHLNLAQARTWSADISLLSLRVGGDDPVDGIVHSLRIGLEPEGKAVVDIAYASQANWANRAGTPSEFLLQLDNSGPETAEGWTLNRLTLPESVRLVTPMPQAFPPIPPFSRKHISLLLEADAPLEGTCEAELRGPGGEILTKDAAIAFTAPLGLPKADYVPEPRPVETGDYRIGALYFPGWDNSLNGGANGGWQRILDCQPSRKPVLGWYDEANPECIDWQIKWLVENGIQYLLVDWYWSWQNTASLEHWIQGFQKARYKSYLKWAVMWANHVSVGFHTEENQRKVVQYWIDNYFCQPEYLKIDGKPVVMMWSPENQELDLHAKGGVKFLNDLSQKMAQEAGYPGIHFSAMKFPEESTSPALIEKFRAWGYESTSIYHYLHPGQPVANPRRYPFELVARSTGTFLRNWVTASNGLPCFLNLSTGWDDRPWNNNREISGKSPALFREICEEGRRVADESGLQKWLLVGPLNEWGEGSYAEPCREYGFGMYEAVRDTFARKPPEGWPLNYTPADVGLGPYEFFNKSNAPSERLRWDFSDGLQEWHQFSNVKEVKTENGILSLLTSGNDPQLHIRLLPRKASSIADIRIRIKASHPGAAFQENLQLFWTTNTTPVCAENSIGTTFPADGEFHDILLKMADASRWRGIITGLRLDPSMHKDIHLEIDEIELMLKEE